MNKVLNRPMFRKEALKKGHLKPIKAKVGSDIGIMVGQGSTAPQVPAIRKPPTFMERLSVSTPVRYGKGFLRNIGTGPFAFGSELMYNALERTDPQGRLSEPVKLGISGLTGYGANLGARAIAPSLMGAGMIPFGVGMAGAAGLAKLYDIGKEGVELRKKINQMTPTERAEFSRQNRLKAFDIMDDQEMSTLSRLNPKLDEIVKKEIKIQGRPGSGRPGAKSSEVDVATSPDNTTQFGNTKTIDTAKIAENALPPQLGDRGKSMDDMSGVQVPPPSNTKTVVKEKEKKDLKENLNADKDSITAGSALKLQLDEAQKMVEDLRKGKGSNANLVFLTNLAAGLLTGKTQKGGVGGALEVLGSALGPAVNNMVMVKMKEDEIRDNLLGRVLDFKSNFLKAQNEAFEMPDTMDVGVIQFTNDAGRIVNVPGRILKDGTKQRATGRVVNGVSEYVTVDPALNFIKLDDANKETLELAEGIAGKYAAVNLINRSLDIIQRGDADAGVTGAIGLYGGRITEALGDVFDFVTIRGNSKSELKTAGKAAFEIEKNKAAIALVASGEFEDKQKALKYLNTSLGTFDKNYNSALRSAKKRLKDGDALDYERLAINETVLVYKLANSLKAKDRLTQKDIEMAKGLVKVFPLFRGERNVIASLTATAETILDDIKQQERLYERAGGSSEYLLNERKAYGLLPEGMTVDTMTDFDSQQFRDLQKKIDELTEEDFERIFPDTFFD